MKKRILPILLALILAALLLPTIALAAGSSGSIERVGITHDNGVLKNAVSVDLKNVNFESSVQVQLYRDETLLTTATLNTDKLGAGSYPYLTCCIATETADEYWSLTPWTPKDDVVPDKAVLVVDGHEQDTKTFKLDADEWAALPGTAPYSGSIESAVITHDNGVLKDAVSVELQDVNFESSVQVQLYSGDTLLTKATLQGVTPGSYDFLTCCIATETADECWSLTPWTPKDDVVPNKVVLFVDGHKLDEKTFTLDADEWAALPGTELFYTVTFMDGRNVYETVRVNADGTGTVKLFTPSKPGYIFMGWKCSDGYTHQAGEVIEVTGNMTFTAIWANMPDITPGTPGGDDEPVVPDFPFTDVREGQWFYEAVKYVYSEGIMNGMDRYTFAPNGSLTRAMVWTMLARLDGVDTEGGATWYSKAQEWAVEAGVSDGTDPMGNITREQLVTMLWRLNGSETVTGSLTGFTDYDKVSDWAGNAMLWATVNGIIEGDEANALNPTAGCTRAQAAAMLMRFCENVELSPTV